MKLSLGGLHEVVHVSYATTVEQDYYHLLT